MAYPINAQVQEAAMSLNEYEDFVYNSCLIDKEDPISEWKKIHDQKEKICEFLNKTSKIRIIGEDTDLTFNVAGRKWINSDGKETCQAARCSQLPLKIRQMAQLDSLFPESFQQRS